MKLVHRIESARDWLDEAKGRHLDVGLVPTMGNLHDGHMTLVRACRRERGACVVSIFVNPTQFGPNEDFASYPRTLEADLRQLDEAGVDLVFNPSVEEMYPDGQEDHVTVSVPALASTLCGTSRPGHFDGVATVVAKLFNIIGPDKAFFGQKDWQQLVVIRAMVRQLNMPVEIVGVATVREASGLALSSRNSYLSSQDRQRAALISRTLTAMKKAIEAGARDYAALAADAQATLAAAGFDIDYVAVRDAAKLAAPAPESAELRILAAVRLGGTRLIDNVPVSIR